MSLRYLSGGESHGPGLTGLIEGLPANLEVDIGFINGQLSRRQQGYGRGGRMAIEKDKAVFMGGLRFSRTTGAPVVVQIMNKDYEAWKEQMQPLEPPPGTLAAVTAPRPGHADLPGALKYNQRDLRNILERASARETAMRVAVGSIARLLLKEFDVTISSLVVSVGPIKAEAVPGTTAAVQAKADGSPLRCVDRRAEKLMMAYIDKVRAEGDTVGGVFEVTAQNLPPGLGSHVQWDRRLDGCLARAFMSIQAVKGVEIGQGFEAALLPGSKVHDEIFYTAAKGYYRSTNRAGGLEGGITNGSPVVVRCAVKPIPTLLKPLQSVEMNTHAPFEARVERSDVCAVPAASVVGEAVLAWELAAAFTAKFGGDSLEEMKANYRNYLAYLSRR